MKNLINGDLDLRSSDNKSDNESDNESDLMINLLRIENVF